MFKSIRALARDKTAGRGLIAAAAIASLAGPRRRSGPFCDTEVTRV